jgi:hypothetical protein
MTTLLLLVLSIAFLATRSDGKILAASNSEALSSLAVFRAKEGGAPLLIDEGKDGSSRRQDGRGARESRRAVNIQPPKKESKIKRIFNKIFKNPFE